MRHLRFRFLIFIALAASGLLLGSGCRRGDSFDMSRRTASWNAAKNNARQELTEIPTPSKSDYAAVDQESQWQNPFLTVETAMIQLRIYLPDENSSAVDRGGMTRLSAARKHTLNVRLADLPRALTALPDGAWPYGRVVAINTQLAPPQDQKLLHKNLGITIAALQDMGIAVDDWTGRGQTR